jgi:tetratricopeptide (TPR) repeat protein
MRIAAAFVVVACFGVLGVSQTERQRPASQTQNDRTTLGSIKGRIVMPSGSFAAESIKVTLLNLRETVATVYTENQGQFEFRSLAPGIYQLEVEGDRRKFDVRTESVQVYRGAPSVVTLALKEKDASGERAATAISVSELDRGVPSNAKKEFEKASRAANQGKTDEGIAHLRKAIAFYPNFVMAHNDLGAQLLAFGKLDEAADELSKAVSLDEKAFNPALNLGIVLVNQHRFAEATGVLSKAISLEPNAPAARLYFGLASMGLGNLEMAEKELKTAYSLGGTQFALAHFHLGQLYLSKGDRNSALSSFQLYLREVPDAANAEQVRKTIAMLR